MSPRLPRTHVRKQENSLGYRQQLSAERRRPLRQSPIALAQFEKRQSELWRLTFFLLLVISIVFAVVSWDTHSFVCPSL